MFKKIIITLMLTTVLLFNGCSKDITESKVQKDIEGKSIGKYTALNTVDEVLIKSKDVNDDSVKVTAEVKFKDDNGEKLETEVYVYYVDGEFKKVERNEWKSIDKVE